MRTILLYFCLSISAMAQGVSLNWSYPSNALAYASSNDWPTCFKIYESPSPTNPVVNWTVIYCQSWSNTPISGYDGTNFIFSLTNAAPVGQAFYVATASNIWGESGLSNTSSVPPVPLVLQTKIIKN